MNPWVTFWAPYVGPSAAGSANLPPAGQINLTPGALNFPLTDFPLPRLGQGIPSGQTFSADATGVTDPDGYALASIPPFAGAPGVVFQWDLAANGFVSLDAAAGATVNITATAGGDAPDLRVTASDGVDGRGAAIAFSVVEARPNGPYAGLVNQPVTLDASGSTAGTLGKLPSDAAPGDPVLDLVWDVTGRPAGSNPVLANPRGEDATFTSDAAGRYDLTLRVTETVSGVSHSATTSLDLT
jgi:hypothetical protein